MSSESMLAKFRKLVRALQHRIHAVWNFVGNPELWERRWWLLPFQIEHRLELGRSSHRYRLEHPQLELLENRFLLANNVLFTFDPGSHDDLVSDGLLSVLEAPGEDITIGIDALASIPSDVDLTIEAADSILFDSNLSSVFFPTGPDNVINLSTDFVGGGKIETLGEFSGFFSAGAPFNIDAGGDLNLSGLFASGIDSSLNAGTQQLGDLNIDLFFGAASSLSASGDINLDVVGLDELDALSETGNISDAPESDITVTGNVSLQASLGDIEIGELTTDSTSVSGDISATAMNVTFYNDAVTNLDVVTASDTLKIVTRGNLTNSPSGSVSAPTSTFIAREGGINLTSISADTANLDATGDIALDDVDDLNLGDVFAEKDLTVSVPGSIGSSGAQIAVFGNTTLTAGNDILLPDPDGTKTQVFGEDVSLEGDVIVLNADSFTGFEDLKLELIDANDLEVDAGGPVSLSNVSVTGSLSVSAGGDITDDEVVEVGNTLSASADLNGDLFDIALDNPGNDLGTVGIETAQDAHLVDKNAITFAATSVSGNFDVHSGDLISQVGEISVAGATSIVAQHNGDEFDILLDNLANDLGNVGAIGDDIKLADVDGLGLNEIQANSLEVDAGGSISQLAATTITGSTRISARKVNSVFDITFEQASNDLNSVEFDGKTVSLIDKNSVSVSGSISDDLVIVAGGDIGQDAPVSVAGSTSLLAQDGADFFDITLDDLGNDFADFSSVGDDVSLTDLDALQLGEIDASTLTVSTGGDIGQTGTVSVSGSTTLTAQKGSDNFDIALDDLDNNFGEVSSLGDDVSLSDLDDLQIGLTDAGLLTVRSGGNISQTAAVSVSGLTSLTAMGDITLDEIGNDLDEIDASGDAITIRDADALALGEIDASILSASVGGQLSDTDGKRISVSGNTSLSADLFDIALDNGLHNFASVDASADDIALTDLSDILLGDIDAVGDLRVQAASIDDGATAGDSQDIDVAGLTSLSASGDITVDDLTNEILEFQVDGANVAASSQVPMEIPTLDAAGIAEFNAPSLVIPAGSSIESNGISVSLTDDVGGGSVDILTAVVSGGPVEISGSAAADVFTITPSSSATFTILGDSPTTNPGDELIVNLQGAGQGAIIANPGGFAPPNGVIQFASPHQPIAFNNIELIRDNAPPRVIDVLVSGDQWNTTDEFDAFSIFSHDRCTPLPWNNLNTIEVVFDRDVNVTIDSVDLSGAGVYEFFPDDPTDTAPNDGFQYDPATRTATYKVNRSIGLDQLTIVVDGEVTDASPVEGKDTGLLLNDGSDEVVLFDVLPGDVNGDRSVNNADLFALRRVMSPFQFGATYDAFADPDHDGFIGLRDLISVARLRGTNLASCNAGSGAFFSFSSAGDVGDGNGKGEGEGPDRIGTNKPASPSSAEGNHRYIAGAPPVSSKLTSVFCAIGSLSMPHKHSVGPVVSPAIRRALPQVDTRPTSITTRLLVHPPVHPKTSAVEPVLGGSILEPIQLLKSGIESER